MYLSNKANDFEHRFANVVALRGDVLRKALRYVDFVGDGGTDAHLIEAVRKMREAIEHANELYGGIEGLEHMTLNSSGFRNPVT